MTAVAPVAPTLHRMTVKVKHPHMRVRCTVLVRKEGGSLSMTIPHNVVRKWKLEPKQRLIVRSTDEGILMYPRYFVRITHGREVPD